MLETARTALRLPVAAISVCAYFSKVKIHNGAIFSNVDQSTVFTIVGGLILFPQSLLNELVGSRRLRSMGNGIKYKNIQK